jgi:hypothetical protein
LSKTKSDKTLKIEFSALENIEDCWFAWRSIGAGGLYLLYESSNTVIRSFMVVRIKMVIRQKWLSGFYLFFIY